MKKLLFTLLLVVPIYLMANIFVQNISAAQFFVCEICGNGWEDRQVLGKNIGNCIDGYNHFLHPTGSYPIDILPRNELEEYVSEMQGLWADNGEKNKIFVEGMYLNGCLIRSMVKVIRDANNFSYNLIIQDDKTRSVDFRLEGTVMYYDGKAYHVMKR